MNLSCQDERAIKSDGALSCVIPRKPFLLKRDFSYGWDAVVQAALKTSVVSRKYLYIVVIEKVLHFQRELHKSPRKSSVFVCSSDLRGLPLNQLISATRH